MDNQSRSVARRVLRDAGEHERFFDYSDAERLVWMIERAFQIGKEQRQVASIPNCGGESTLLGELNQNSSQMFRSSARRRSAP